MPVHWNPANRYKPRNEREAAEMFDALNRRQPFGGDYKPKCKKCKKRMRSAGHTNEDGVCKNGK